MELSFLSLRSSLDLQSTFFWSPQVSSSSLYPDLSRRLFFMAMRLLVPGDRRMLFRAMELAWCSPLLREKNTPDRRASSLSQAAFLLIVTLVSRRRVILSVKPVVVVLKEGLSDLVLH